MSGPQTILVASGSESAIGQALRKAGWVVETAGDALMVHNVARRAKPAGAVIDADLPRGGAQLALKWIRSNVDCATIPVVVLSTDPNRDHLYVDYGAQSVLPARAEPQAIAEQLRQLLKLERTVGEAPAEVLGDPVRLAALRASGLLDSEPERAFDDIIQLVLDLLKAPTSLLSIVDRDRQFFKSQIGLRGQAAAERQTPLSHSFCQWVVSGREPIAIRDARAHPLLKTNLAIRDLGVIAYTGVPVRSADGQSLGSLCAIDARPRDWTRDDVDTLADIAKLVEAGVAHSMLVKQPPQTTAEFDRYVEAAGNAVTAATRLLRRLSPNQAERDILLASIDRHTGHLVQLNRLIQVAHAIKPAAAN